MKISIITPTFNSAATLRDTLDSIGGQDYLHVEHLIVDGGSGDDTLAIAGHYPRVSRIVSEPDEGLYDAMNKGIALATGDVIGILNSDDFYTHSKVLSRVAALFELTGADALYGDLEYVDAIDNQRIVRRWKSRPYQPGLFLRGWMPPHPTFFVRRRVYEQFGAFNTLLRFSADYELILRFLYRHRVSACYLPEVMVRMRTGGHSNASLGNRIRANREDRLAWRLNGLRPAFYTLCWKPFSKLGQYF